MKTRKDSEDAVMLKQVYKDYPRVQLKGKRVLDLGAHIGGFTNRAIDEGASSVVAVEPWSENYDLLQENVGHLPGVTLLKKAVTNHPTLTMTIGKPGSTGGVSGYIKRRPRPDALVEVVDGVSFQTLLDTFKPEVVKMDIEGGEYEALPANLEGVQQICGELHTSSLENTQKALDIIKWLEANDFAVIFLRSSDRWRLMWLNFHAQHRRHCGKEMKGLTPFTMDGKLSRVK